MPRGRTPRSSTAVTHALKEAQLLLAIMDPHRLSVRPHGVVVAPAVIR